MVPMPADNLHRFLFEHQDIRGEIVQLDATCRDAVAGHEYPEHIRQLLGELLAACALLTATIKFDATLGMEIRGDGPLTLLMAESNPGLHRHAQKLRGVARYDAETIADHDDASLRELTGAGRIVITITPKQGRRYQGIVPLECSSIAGCVEAYFTQSEQLPTHLWLAANDSGAAGLLLQQLPPETQTPIRDDDAWNRIHHLA